jgi:hypothetical protein
VRILVCRKTRNSENPKNGKSQKLKKVKLEPPDFGRRRPRPMRRDVLGLLALCAIQPCVAYFDINLLADIAKLQADRQSALKLTRVEQRRRLQEAAPKPEDEKPSNGTFWDRLTEEGKSPGKRAAITTIIAVAVVVVVCICCWCVPIMDVACWKGRDDVALRETYMPRAKPPSVVDQDELGEDVPVAAGDEIIRARKPAPSARV